MSLQSLTPSPFRVVDEINQGMDPKNERLVHSRMVDIACGIANAEPNPNDPSPNSDNDDDDDDDEGGDGLAKRGGSQYFLITPKLLHDLSYVRGMQVMCIASGEYMPKEAKQVDFKRAVNVMRGKKGLDGSGLGGMDGMSGLADRSIGSIGGRGRSMGVAAG